MHSIGTALCAGMLLVGGRAQGDERRDLATYRESSELFSAAAAAERRGLFDEARASYLRAVERDPDFVEAIVNLARLDIAGGDLDAAERWLERAKRVRSDYPMVAATSGLLALARNDLSGALDALSQAHRREPGDAEVAVNLGAVLIQRSRLEEARKVLAALLHEHPDHTAALYNLALANDLSGRFDEASLGYQRFLSIAALDDSGREGVQQRLEAMAASSNGGRKRDGE
jgi:Flp pilus assembly protein TadD